MRTVAEYNHDDLSWSLSAALAYVCLIWYCTVIIVCALGYIQLWRYYSSQHPASRSSTSSNPPRVTIIRPVKGIEPHLYECLAATFQQDYPSHLLSIRLCISDPKDPSVPILRQLLHDFPQFDATILVEEEDVALDSGSLGPNPKIRNMSRAYREAKGDIVWIIDCNVWVAKSTLGRMIDTLQETPAKFVHLLPLVIDVTTEQSSEESQSLVAGPAGSTLASSSNTNASGELRRADTTLDVSQYGGGRLEEMFMSSSHAKFYTAINTVLIAPCIVGKSTMFRKSHLDHLTSGRGLDYFSENICEDHMIGDLLWRGSVPEELSGQVWAKHAMVFGDLAIQPMAGMSVRDYIARRVRWLRVRKFTVLLATLVEPGTESFLCSSFGAFAATKLGFLQPTWTSFAVFWLLSVSVWCAADRQLYKMLQSAASVSQDSDTPGFVSRGLFRDRRTLQAWVFAWLGRECLALPIWSWAVLGGGTVMWRGKRFWVGYDLKVHELPAQPKGRQD